MAIYLIDYIFIHLFFEGDWYCHDLVIYLFY